MLKLAHRPTAMQLFQWGTLLLILAGALLIRMILAPNPGMEFDMATNLGWARSAVELGLARSYGEQVGGTMIPNYPPFSMMIFAAVGHITQTFFPAALETGAPVFRILMKTPPILADIAIAFLLALVIARWRGWKAGNLAALVVALHPAMFYESALWGQTDSIHTLLLVGALIAVITERPMLTGALAILAFLTKAQSAALAPLLLAVFFARPRWLIEGFIGCLTALIAVLLPFAIGGALSDIWNVYTGSVGYYAIISSSAYNFWWALLADSAWGKSDTDILFGIVTYRTAGILIFGGVVATTLWVLRRRLTLRMPYHRKVVVLFSVASLFALAFFLFLTEMHERYLFPFVALGLPVAFLSRRAAVLYGLISFLFFLNLLGFLPWTHVERALHREFPSLDVLFASAQVFLCILWMQMTLALRSPAELAKIPGPAARRRGQEWRVWLRWPGLRKTA